MCENTEIYISRKTITQTLPGKVHIYANSPNILDIDIEPLMIQGVDQVAQKLLIERVRVHKLNFLNAICCLESYSHTLHMLSLINSC